VSCWNAPNVGLQLSLRQRLSYGDATASTDGRMSFWQLKHNSAMTYVLVSACLEAFSIRNAFRRVKESADSFRRGQIRHFRLRSIRRFVAGLPVKTQAGRQ
jgi:hypothetical protein